MSDNYSRKVLRVPLTLIRHLCQEGFPEDGTIVDCRYVGDSGSIDCWVESATFSDIEAAEIMQVTWKVPVEE